MERVQKRIISSSIDSESNISAVPQVLKAYKLCFIGLRRRLRTEKDALMRCGNGEFPAPRVMKKEQFYIKYTSCRFYATPISIMQQSKPHIPFNFFTLAIFKHVDTIPQKAH
jgi:hypothetical protein